MARQVLHSHIQLAEFLDVAGWREVEPGVPELALGCTFDPAIFKSRTHFEKPGRLSHPSASSGTPGSTCATCTSRKFCELYVAVQDLPAPLGQHSAEW